MRFLTLSAAALYTRALVGKKRGLVAQTIQGGLQAAGLKIAIVASRFNDFVVSRLVGGAVDTLERLGAPSDSISVYRVPGSFEIPLIAKKLANGGKWDAILCLGCLIRGDTPHFEFIAAEVTRAISRISLESGIPVAFGILTADTVDQAVDRAGMKSGNKGVEAAMAAVEAANLCRQL